MSDNPIKPVTTRSSSSLDRKVLREVQNIAKDIKTTQMELIKQYEAPHQAKASPYYQDRPFYNAEVRKDSTWETSWKDVKTREDYIETITRKDSLKKLNII